MNHQRKWYLLVLILLVACATKTTQPDGTDTQDPFSVTLGKRAQQAALILSVTKGAMQGYADNGTITQATADRNKANIDKVLLALSVAVQVGANGQSMLVKCFMDGNCTDAQNMQAAEALGQAFALLGQLGNLVK